MKVKNSFFVLALLAFTFSFTSCAPTADSRNNDGAVLTQTVFEGESEIFMGYGEIFPVKLVLTFEDAEKTSDTAGFGIEALVGDFKCSVLAEDEEVAYVKGKYIIKDENEFINGTITGFVTEIKNIGNEPKIIDPTGYSDEELAYLMNEITVILEVTDGTLELPEDYASRYDFTGAISFTRK